MSVDERLAELAEATVAAGADPPKPPDSLDVLAEIDAAVAPLRLPGEVRRFWELVDPCSLGVECFPELTRPSFALDAWRNHLEAPGMVPRVLFPVGYSSHTFTFVELHGPDADDGGALFYWMYGGCPFKLMHLGISDLLIAIMEALRAGRFDRFGESLIVEIDEPARPLVHPVFGPVDAIPEQITSWPEAWLVRSGVDAERRNPEGADHTIEEVLEAAANTPVRARIHATVERLAGMAAGTSVLVSDDTGTMRIWCPGHVTAIGPRSGVEFEFHIVAARRDDDRAPRTASDSEDPRVTSLAEHYAAVLGPSDAIAEDVRRLEPW